jgi:hypothetical protein
MDNSQTFKASTFSPGIRDGKVQFLNYLRNSLKGYDYTQLLAGKLLFAVCYKVATESCKVEFCNF